MAMKRLWYCYGWSGKVSPYSDTRSVGCYTSFGMHSHVVCSSAVGWPGLTPCAHNINSGGLMRLDYNTSLTALMSTAIEQIQSRSQQREHVYTLYVGFLEEYSNFINLVSDFCGSSVTRYSSSCVVQHGMITSKQNSQDPNCPNAAALDSSFG